MRVAALAPGLIASLIILACAPAAPDQDTKPGNDSKAKPKCSGIIDSRDWPNPYIIVRATDVVVTLHRSSVPEHEMPLSQLAAYLRQLPTDAWPCGKVVAAGEIGIRRPNDGPAIRENRARVNEILKKLEVKVDWWPSA